MENKMNNKTQIRENLKKQIKIFLLSFALLANLNANGQEFFVNNNQEVRAVASRTELTRIVFDSPVIEVHALSEEIEYVIEHHDIYLRMLNLEKPVNFFVKTEDEYTYELILIAESTPAEQIFIHNQNTYTKESAEIKKDTKAKYNHVPEYFSEVSEELKARIAKIIEIALNPQKHLGYEFLSKDHYLSSPIKDITMRLEESVVGGNLIAEKILLTNRSKRPIKINSRNFATLKYLALYLDNLNQDEIQPGQNATLIRVYEN